MLGGYLDKGIFCLVYKSINQTHFQMEFSCVFSEMFIVCCNSVLGKVYSTPTSIILIEVVFRVKLFE